MATQNRPAVTLSAGLKPAGVTQKVPAKVEEIDAPVINDIAEPPEVQRTEDASVQAWPVVIGVRNDSRAAIVCPVCGLHSSPGTLRTITLHDADHARASVQNIRDLAALQNVSAEIIITGLPSGL
jgi:hypothetical protein